MPLRRQSKCQVCKAQDANYSCPSCFATYCSATCYKNHKGASCADSGITDIVREQTFSATSDAERHAERRSEESFTPDEKPLRALTSLKWPYIPEKSVFSDPLERDEPKALQLRHYEAIATSPEIRSALSSNTVLQALLRKVDGLRGPEREEALENLLGVADRSAQDTSFRKRIRDFNESEEGRRGLKQLAEAVEKAVRGDDRSVLGLDWTDDGQRV